MRESPTNRTSIDPTGIYRYRYALLYLPWATRRPWCMAFELGTQAPVAVRLSLPLVVATL